jgi:protein ImuB
MSMLWLCIHLPRLAAEVIARAGSVREPFAVVEGEGARQTVSAASPEAERAGLRAGMTLGAAHALAPGLSVFRRDETAESAALSRLAAWAGRFTPVASLVPPREIVLEVAGSARLFRGLDNLMGQAGEGLRELGYTAFLGLAPVPLAAALLARTRPGARVTEAGSLERELFSVPLEALDFPPEILEALKGLGVRCFGDCLGLPRPGLARRFGEEPVRYLDRALGTLPDPRDPFALPSRFEGRLPLYAEVAEAEPLLFAARRLLLELAGYLEARGGGAASVRLTLFHREERRTRIEVGLLSPSRDPGRLLGLLRERLARTRIPEPVSAVGLSVEEILPLSPANREFWKEPARKDPDAWPELVERLRARLGGEAARGLRTAAEHRPERASVLSDPSPGDEPESPLGFEPRPLWLLPRPVPLEGKEVTLLAGPERIESGWWDGDDARRDYFVAEDPRGCRLWVFRERDGRRRWYLHGIFG